MRPASEGVTTSVKSRTIAAERSIGFEAYGVRVTVEVSDVALVPQLEQVLPLQARRRAPSSSDDRFTLTVDQTGRCTITGDSERTEVDGIPGALATLGGSLFMHVIAEARDRLFVHAGAVGAGRHAIVLPGPTGTGKSTLVAALVAAGAVYYSDDWAPIDADGRLHPYPKPLLLRDPASPVHRTYSADALGASSGRESLPVGIVAHIPFASTGFECARRTAADGALLLLKNSAGVDRRPALALRAATQAALRALVLEGKRTDPDAAAAELLTLARDLQPSPRPQRD